MFSASGSHDQDGRRVYIMAKNLQKSSSPELVDRFSLKLVCIIGNSGPIIVYLNVDPRLTLTYFTKRSNLVACAFE